MKKLIIAIFCFCSITAFAQNGFFLQPEIGAGISNTCWQPLVFKGLPGQESVFSYQGQVDLGYKAGKWQFITGIGYMRTGVRLQPGSIFNFNKEDYPILFDNLQVPYNLRITDFNPHLIMPVKVGYEFSRFSDRLAFVPLLGAELSYNMQRTFVFQKQNRVESLASFNDNCNQFSVIGLLQLNFEYKLSDRYDITAGPSVHYMLTSELNFKDQQDYSVLMNLGLKWNFKPRHLVKG